MTSVILLQFNNAHLTQKALRSFFRHHSSGFEVIVVDNGSEDGRIKELRDEFPGLLFVENQANLGFSAANNRAAHQARGDLLFFLNNDILCTMDGVTPIQNEFSRDPKIGVAGPRLLNRDGSYQLSCGDLPTFFLEIRDKIIFRLADRNVHAVRSWHEHRHHQKRTVGWVTGAALCIRKELFLRLGGFDEKMFMYFEDKDLCLRVSRAGNRVLYLPGVSMIHMRGASSAGSSLTSMSDRYRHSQIRYYEKHRPSWEQALLKTYLAITGKLPRNSV